MATDTYARDRRSLATWVAGVVAVLLTGAVGFAHGTLWSHEVALTQLQTQATNDQRVLIEIKDILKEMRADQRGRP